MTREIVWSPAAEKDLENISEYLNNKWNSKVALSFINKIEKSTLLISNNPRIFSLINKKLGIRKCVVTKHNSLFYRENSSNRIEIIRLFDNRQHPKKLTF